MPTKTKLFLPFITVKLRVVQIWKQFSDDSNFLLGAFACFRRLSPANAGAFWLLYVHSPAFSGFRQLSPAYFPFMADIFWPTIFARVKFFAILLQNFARCTLGAVGKFSCCILKNPNYFHKT